MKRSVALRHSLKTAQHTCKWCANASQDAHLLTVALEEGSDDRTTLSFAARHFLEIGTAFDDLVRLAGQSDLPHGRKPFTLKPVLDSGRHLTVCVYDYAKRALRHCITEEGRMAYLGWW